MKVNSAYIFFIASVASVVDASGNLRSRQNLVHDAEEEMESRVKNKPVGDMKENPDDSHLLHGKYERLMANEQQHGEEKSRLATLEKHRKMEEFGEDDISFHEMTLEEAEEL